MLLEKQCNRHLRLHDKILGEIIGEGERDRGIIGDGGDRGGKWICGDDDDDDDDGNDSGCKEGDGDGDDDGSCGVYIYKKLIRSHDQDILRQRNIIYIYRFGFSTLS